MIIFKTKNLNHKLYRRLINNILIHLDPKQSVKEFNKKWTIRIHPLSATNEDYFKHTESTSGGKINTGMPSGVTGKYVMDLFLHDDTNIFKFRENSDRIQHELCHAKLINTPYFVKGVHNKITNTGQYLKSFKFWFWTNRWKFWQPIQITVIDIREHLNK